MNSRHQLPAPVALTMILLVAGTITLLLMQAINNINFKLAADAAARNQIITEASL